MQIREDDLSGPEIARLLERHLAHMAEHTPAESIYALDLDALRAPDITFWSAWEEGELVGCGALRELALDHGEIKSMHAAQERRGEGIGKRIVAFIIDEAQRRGYARLSLETGSMAGFEPARRLYAGFGFAPCGPFGDYAFDANSVYMTRTL
jgi:putative acetyltransferase